MLSIWTTSDGLRVEVTAAPPGVYLDCCALRRIADTPDLAEPLLQRLAVGGTLVLSIAHLMEFSRQDPGPSLDRLRALFHRVGSAFTFVESSISKVIERWRADPEHDEVAASFDTEMAIAYALGDPLRGGPSTAEYLVDFATEMGPRYRDRVEETKQHVRRAIQLAHDASRARDARRRVPPTHGLRSADCFQMMLLHAFRDPRPFDDNDALDIVHASVPLAMCEFVVLDKEWAHYARQVPRPPRHADVFPATPEGLTRFLDALEAWTPAPEVK